MSEQDDTTYLVPSTRVKLATDAEELSSRRAPVVVLLVDENILSKFGVSTVLYELPEKKLRVMTLLAFI